MARRYYVLELTLFASGAALKCYWQARRRELDRAAAENLCKELNGGSLRVVSMKHSEKKQRRPLPFNTVAFLKACSTSLGIGPGAAMHAAESLYLAGYLSYPRTESTAFPSSFVARHELGSRFRAGHPYVGYVDKLLGSEGALESPKGGVDRGDHPPISAVRPASQRELGAGEQWRVYDIVLRTFLASISADAVWSATKIGLECKGQSFGVAARSLKRPGFLEILRRRYGDDDDDDVDEAEEERMLPTLSEGDSFPVFAPGAATKEASRAVVSVVDRLTKPPDYLTESELISAMESNGIGTDASIPVHIENVLKRNYAELIPGRRLKPTKLGLVLVQGYLSIDASLVMPQVRAEIERNCEKVAKGEALRSPVVSAALSDFSDKYAYFVANIDKMDLLFASSFAALKDAGRPYTRDGFTKQYLTYIVGPPPRLYNRFTETVYPLPVGGACKQLEGQYCPLCRFELLRYSVGNPTRTFPLCPNCYGNPPKCQEGHAEDENDEAQASSKQRHLCLACPLPDDHPLIEAICVGFESDLLDENDRDEDAAIVIDVSGGNKQQLVSTRSALIATFGDKHLVHKLEASKKHDPDSGARLLQVIFHKDKSPLPDSDTVYVASLATDELLKSLLRIHRGSERLKAPTKRGGRGRGCRGRSRGRGGRRMSDKAKKMSFRDF